MSSGMWFVVSVPKKQYEIKSDDAVSTHNSIADNTSYTLSLIVDELELADEIDVDEPETPNVANIEKPGGVNGRNVEKLPTINVANIEEPDSAILSKPKDNGEVKRNSEKLNSLYSNIYFVEKKGPLEVMLREVLPLLGIFDAVWSSHEDDLFYQVYFPCESAERCDHILRALSVRGIGIISQSTVAVLPCSIFYRESEYSDRESEEDTDDEKNDKSGEDESMKLRNVKSKSNKGFKAMQKQFLKSITARLTVAQVVESVKMGSQLTFDFVMFVILASLIAAFGLMENSSVIIVASMLISPLMGPILAGTFGAAVRDKSLLSLGIKAELLGLFVCLVIGFLVGLACSEKYGDSPFPTSEMFGRGQLRSLWVGVLIAVPSGAGVALSVLGGNAGSLVGVAISASLLPPAVNAGLLWGISFLKFVKSFFYEPVWVLVNEEDVSINEALVLPEGYKPSFSMKMDEECAVLGALSLLLTIINIICIIVSALVVLKIKEVAPRTNVKRTSRFWTQDIKIARDYNKTLRSQEAEQMGQTFLKEWAHCNGMNEDAFLRGDKKTQYVTLQDMLKDVEDDDVYRSVLTYVPRTQDVARRMTLGVLSFNRNLTVPIRDVENGVHYSSFKRVFSRRRKNPKDGETKEKDPDLDGIDLRRHSDPAGTIRISDTLRKSLRHSGNPTPGSLWPPQSSLRKMSNHRFLVTPSDDPLASFIPPLPPRFGEINERL